MPAHVGPSPWVAGDLAPERLGDRLRQRARSVDGELSRSGRAGDSSRPADARLGLGADTGSLSKPPCVDRLAELLDRTNAERSSDLEHPLLADPQHSAEADELGVDRLLELVQLGAILPVSASSRSRAAIPARSLAALERFLRAPSPRPERGSRGSSAARR